MKRVKGECLNEGGLSFIPQIGELLHTPCLCLMSEGARKKGETDAQMAKCDFEVRGSGEKTI